MVSTVLLRISETATLVDRPHPVPVEYRPIWRIAQLVMIMDYCGRGGKCSSLKISALSWGLRNRSTRRNIILLAQGRFLEMDSFAIRFDPTTVRVINLSCGLGYVAKLDSGMLSLQEPGKALAKLIRDTGELFTAEKEALTTIGKSLTETNLKSYAADPRL